MYSIRKDKAGFTLIEMLVVTAIAAVVSLVIYSTFSSGLKIWLRLTRQMPQEDICIFFEKFGSDLRNCFSFTGIPFTADTGKLEFATLVQSARLGHRSAGELIYSYDDQRHILSRRQRDFSAVYRDEDGASQTALGNIKSLLFQYYFYDKERKEYLWANEWQEVKGRLPLAVRIELAFEDGEQLKKITRTVSIPVAH
jgi:prepilin-type N-terminal cleavage/methylation domain-containing protein